MKWLTDCLRHIGQVLSGKAEWLDKQEAEVREQFSAFNATVRKLLLATFLAGVLLGWKLHSLWGAG